MKSYFIIFIVVLIGFQELLAQEQTKNNNWEAVVGMNLVSPPSIGIGIKHNKRITTSLIGGVYSGFLKRSGWELGVHNLIYKKKRKNKAELSRWYWYQSVLYNTYKFTSTEGNAWIDEDYIGANLAFGRSFYFTPYIGLNTHVGILFSYSLKHNANAVIAPAYGFIRIPQPNLGMFFFYKF